MGKSVDDLIRGAKEYKDEQAAAKKLKAKKAAAEDNDRLLAAVIEEDFKKLEAEADAMAEKAFTYYPGKRPT